MLVHLVRHAVAKPRKSWSQADDERPLDTSGRRQADALPSHRQWDDVTSIVSSPAIRCVDTVMPLADSLGLEVAVDHRLAEGSDPTRVLELIEGSGPGDLVLCSHGDVIPDVLRLIEFRGADVERPRVWAKGSTWTVAVDEDGFGAATYTRAPDKG